MQSGYGVSEMQQFMVDGICSQFFPLPPATTTATSADLTHKQQQEQQQVQQQPHPFLHHHHHQQQQQQFHHFHQYPNQPHHLHFQDHHPSPPPVPQQQIHHHQSPPRFPTHFHHPIPITQQLFQQNHQFHLFQQEQQRRLHHHHHLQPLDPDPQPPENSASSPRIDVGGSKGAGGGISSFLRPSMNFRLSVNENSGDGGGDSRDGLNDDNGLLQGDEVDGSEERRWPPPPPQSSREEDDSAAAIKEPFWRPLDLDLEYTNRNNNKSFKEKRGRTHQEQQQQQQQEQEFLVLEGSTTKVLTKEPPITNVNAEDGTNSGNNYKIFSELEAICKPGTNTIIIGNNSNNNHHQTGSSSALTGENPPTSLADPSPFGDQNADEVMDDHVEQTSDTSTGEEASLKKATTTSNLNQRGVVSSCITKDKGKRSRRRRKRKQELRSLVAFLETLVKQLMDHQETLHRKFIEALEMRDQQRMATEQAWRQQEATKSMMESKAREEFQAIAAAREAEIVSFLERITGESVNLPTKPPKLQMQREDNNNINVIDNNDNDENHQAAVMSSNRWPKAEVQALIKVRSGLETRFQEPGLKGPLWEEVSSGMAAIGYRRSAKRCKEKWENINKYFRKTKESSKRRPRQSKTCPYFHQLDQLYSKSTAATTSAMTTTNNDSNNSDKNLERRGNSELLDAIVVSKNDQSGGFNNYSDNDMVVVPLRRIVFDTSNCGDGLLQQEGNKDDDDDEGEGESLANSTLPAVKKGEPDEEDERMEESNPPII